MSGGLCRAPFLCLRTTVGLVGSVRAIQLEEPVSTPKQYPQSIVSALEEVDKS